MASRSSPTVASKTWTDKVTRTNKRVFGWCARRNASEATCPWTTLDTRLLGCCHRENTQLAAPTTYTIAISPSYIPTLHSDPTLRASRSNLFHVLHAFERVIVCTARRSMFSFLAILAASYSPVSDQLRPTVNFDPFFGLLPAIDWNRTGGGSHSRPRSSDPNVT